MKAVLSIAGSDSSGGAGIQADIKTIAAHHLYAETVITALTAQNTLGVQGVEDVSAPFVEAQIESVFSDIYPDAVKVGMVSSPDIVDAIARGLVRYKARNIVLDPVMVATSGSALVHGRAVPRMIEQLFPLACLITPNVYEAAALASFPIEGAEDMERAAQALAQMTPGAVLVKGGHSREQTASDYLLLPDGTGRWFHAPRIDNPNTHGTGCTLSSAIACGLACGCDVVSAVAQAKDYLNTLLRAQLNLGQGAGPLDHMAVFS